LFSSGSTRLPGAAAIDWSTPAILPGEDHPLRGGARIRTGTICAAASIRRTGAAIAFFHPALRRAADLRRGRAHPRHSRRDRPLAREDRNIIDPTRARTAVFYSISNCQAGLAGVSFGNFLIKQVVEELSRELPRLETFVTLSPVPASACWMKAADDVPINDKGTHDGLRP
jgi:malonyl-CoA decarboxylase